MTTTPFTRKDIKAFLDTMTHFAKEQKMRFKNGEGSARRVVTNNQFGFTRAIHCYFEKKTRFYVEDCYYSRKELENLLVSSYSY